MTLTLAEHVREFTTGAGQPTPDKPEPMTEAEVHFIAKMIVDETMELLYARYGRHKMEDRLKMLFGDDMKEEGKGGGEIDFVTYLRAVEKTQLATFLQSNYGKALVNKKQGNPERVVGKALMDDLAASDPALAAKLMAGAPNQASHKMRK